MSVRYIFWDCDNTLVNTAEYHWLKHYETFKANGIELGQEHRPYILKNNGPQNWEHLTKYYKIPISQEEYLGLVDRWYIDHMADIKIRDGILEALDICNKYHCKMAVISNSRRKSVQAVLEAKDLAKYMLFIWGKEDYKGSKSEAEAFNSARSYMAKSLEHPVDAQGCLVVEDDMQYIKGADFAGMWSLYRPIGEDNPDKFLEELIGFLL